MADRAEVTSVDAIADFKSALLVYIAKVRPLLDDSASEVLSTREWLRVTQRSLWESRRQACARELSDAQQALFSAELAKLRAPSSAELMAVQKAKRALAAAEEKLRIVKRTSTSFEKEALPRLKQIENLRSRVTNDLQKGVHSLEKTLLSLQRYADVQQPSPLPPISNDGETPREVP